MHCVHTLAGVDINRIQRRKVISVSCEQWPRLPGVQLDLVQEELCKEVWFAKVRVPVRMRRGKACLSRGVEKSRTLSPEINGNQQKSLEINREINRNQSKNHKIQPEIRSVMWTHSL